MSEPIALYENDEGPIEGSIMPTTTSKSLSTQFARIVSNALSPVTISLPFIMNKVLILQRRWEGLSPERTGNFPSFLLETLAAFQ